jgi:hypothetical protein
VQAEPLFDREGLVALVALVGHLAGVSSHVNGEAANLNKLEKMQTMEQHILVTYA